MKVGPSFQNHETLILKWKEKEKKCITYIGNCFLPTNPELYLPVAFFSLLILIIIGHVFKNLPCKLEMLTIQWFYWLGSLTISFLTISNDQKNVLFKIILNQINNTSFPLNYNE